MIGIAAIVVLFFLQCQADVPPPMKDLDQNKILGTWFGIAVGSNCKQFMQMKSDQMPPPVIAYSKDNEKIKSTAAFQTDKGCQQMDFDMSVVDAGHYTCKNGKEDWLPEEDVKQFKEHMMKMGLKEENYIKFHNKATCVPKGV
ncbi:olfactory protein-like [Mantella aurantiaca]